MVGLKFNVQGHIQMARKLRLVAAEIADFTPFYEAALDIIAERSDALFSAEGSNVEKANAWPPLSAKTLKARDRRWGYYRRTPSRPGLMRWTGNLQEKRDRHVTQSRGRLTFTMPYSGYHQDGGKNLPKRVIVDLSNPTNVEIVRALQVHINNAVGIFGRQI